MKATKKEILEVYKVSGLNGLYAFLRKNNIDYTREVYEFGLGGSMKAEKAKKEFLNDDKDENILRLHYYSVSVIARKTGYNYNKLRGIKITIL